MLGDAGAHVLGDEGHYVAPSEVHVPDPRATTASILTEVYGGVAPGCVDANTPAYGEVTIITDTKMMETEASFGAGKIKEGKAKKVKAAKVFDDIPPEYAANTLDQAVMTRRWTEKTQDFGVHFRPDFVTEYTAIGKPTGMVHPDVLAANNHPGADVYAMPDEVGHETVKTPRASQASVDGFIGDSG